MGVNTLAPRRITIDAIDREGFLWEDVDLGSGAVGFTDDAFESLYAWGDETFNQATLAWEAEVQNPAIREVMPQIRELIAAAIEKRLRWTWTEG